MRAHWIAGLVLSQCVSLSIAQANEGFFDSDGVKLRYVAAGKGAPVILLHGFAVPSVEEMWVKNALNEPKVLPDLAREFRVIAMELRGHGQSGKPRDPERYGVEMVEDVVRLLDHLELEQAHVVGYSLGATIAAKLLVMHPDRLFSVTLGGGAPIYRPTPEWLAIGKALAKSLDKEAGAGPLIPVITPAGDPRPSQLQADFLGQALVKGQDQRVLAAVIRGATALEVTEAELRANKIPVLVVYGSREGEAKERIERIKKILSRATFKIIKDGNHTGTFAMPEFRLAIRKFLKAHRH